MPSDLDGDLGVVRDWWQSVATTAPKEVSGLWFGITDLVTDGGVTRHLYVAGCPTFDPSDETAEWATNYCWWPDDRYVFAPGLASLPGSDFVGVLDHAARLIEALRPQEDLAVQGVAVGYDDGDFRIIPAQ